MYMIYMLTNTVNGKKYVGKTNNWVKRWNKHCSKSCDMLISRSIRKHGADNFTMEVLEKTSEQLVDWREIYWIAIKDTMHPNGYNLTYGGDGGNKLVGKTEEEMVAWKKKISDNMPDMSGNNSPMFGRSRPDTADRNRKRTGVYHPSWGKPRPDTAERNRKRTGENSHRHTKNRDKQRGQLTLF